MDSRRMDMKYKNMSENCTRTLRFTLVSLIFYMTIADRFAVSHNSYSWLCSLVLLQHGGQNYKRHFLFLLIFIFLLFFLCTDLTK